MKMYPKTTMISRRFYLLERLDMDKGHLALFGICPQMPDSLHVLSIGECKKAITAVYNKIENSERSRFESKIRSIEGFPPNLTNSTLKPTTVGVDFTTATILLTVALNDSQPFILDTQEESRLKELLECLCLLVKYAAKEILTITDFTEIQDAIEVFPTLNQPF
jgi:hypothetical protein